MLHGQRAAVHDGERVRIANAEHPRPVGHDCGEQAVRGAGGYRAGPVCGGLLLLPVRRARERHEHRGWGRFRRQVVRLRRVRRDDGQRHGGVFKWTIPGTSIAIFEWNEDYLQGSHYHAMLPEWSNRHVNGIHYLPGEVIPEPWQSMFF